MVTYEMTAREMKKVMKCMQESNVLRLQVRLRSMNTAEKTDVCES